MSPIVQTLANGSAYGYRAFAAAGGDYESIATVTVGAGGAADVTFSSIPSTYQHLQVRIMSFNNDTAGGGTGNVRCSGFFNSDQTTSNYINHRLSGNGSTASAGVDSDAKWIHSSVRNSEIGAGVSVSDILDYANTNKYKTMRSIWGWDENGSGEVRLVSGLWMNTAAVNTLKIVPESGSFKQYSSFALYGIKG